MNDTKRRRAARLLSMVLAALFGALPAGAQTTDFCGCAGSPSLGAFVSGDAATHPPGTVRNPSWINSYDHGIRIPLPPDGILVFDSFTVQYYPGFGAGWNTHVFFEPNAANTPVTLLVKGNVTIADAGRLRVSGWSGGAGSAGGLVRAPVFIQFVMGVLGGIAAEPDHLDHLKATADRLFGDDYIFSVLAAGRMQMRMAEQAAAMGGHVRVGLEDNLHIAKGQLATSNAEQVAKVREIVEAVGRTVATPAEARSMLGLKGPEKVGF